MHDFKNLLSFLDLNSTIGCHYLSESDRAKNVNNISPFLLETVKDSQTHTGSADTAFDLFLL